MSTNVLKRLLVQKNLVQKISYEEYKRKNRTIYSAGCSANFFCLVLEGCVQVVIGKEGLKFESRSFSYFGAQAMANTKEVPLADYKPDFTAWPLTDCVLVVISQSQYLAARRASVFECGRNSTIGTPLGAGNGGPRKMGETPPGGGGRGDIFSTEWAKAETQNLEISSKPSSPKAQSSYHPVDKYVGKHSEAGKQPVVAGTSYGIAGKKMSPTSSYKRRLSDQRRLLSDESSSSEDDDSLASPTAGEIRILVDRGGGERAGSGGGEGLSVMMTSRRSGHRSPSTSSSASDYKSSKV